MERRQEERNNETAPMPMRDIEYRLKGANINCVAPYPINNPAPAVNNNGKYFEFVLVSLMERIDWVRQNINGHLA